MRLVLIRTDASQRIGSGHVMRCLTLADALRDRGREIEFICRKQQGNYIDIVREHGYKVHALDGADDYSQYGWLGVSVERDVQETLQALDGRRTEWLIVDHYGISTEWERELAMHVDKLMAIDDMADRGHICHLLLDQNFSLNASKRYQTHVPPSCTQLLGPQFALLRDEFVRTRASLRSRGGRVCKVLVFFGGGDPDNLTGKVISTMIRPEFDGLALDIVIGAANPHRESIVQQLIGRLNTRLMVQVNNMAELMASADLAIGAGGGTTWERMCMGLPTIVVTIAENQLPATHDLHSQGLVRWVGDFRLIDLPSLTKQIAEAVAGTEINRWQSTQCMQLVDGLGVTRVADFLCGMGDARDLNLRHANANDCLLFWHWVNDPLVRESALHSAQIPWQDHCRWFEKTLDCRNKWLFVGEGVMGPIGQVRFERNSNEITIDYSLAAQFRGLGLATLLLKQAITLLKEIADKDDYLHASVLAHNQASVRVFQRLGFAEPAVYDGEIRTFRRRLVEE